MMKTTLSPREDELIRHLMAGATDRQALVDALHISKNGVNISLQRIFRKTGVHDMAGLVLWAVHNGYWKIHNV